MGARRLRRLFSRSRSALGAVAGIGTTAGVLALGVSKGVAVNFSLASGLMLTGAALAAAALGLSGPLLL